MFLFVDYNFTQPFTIPDISTGYDYSTPPSSYLHPLFTTSLPPFNFSSESHAFRVFKISSRENTWLHYYKAYSYLNVSSSSA